MKPGTPEAGFAPTIQLRKAVSGDSPLLRDVAVLCAVLCAWPALPAQKVSGRSPPNNVLILVDDLGYGDVNLELPRLGVLNNPHLKTPVVALRQDNYVLLGFGDAKTKQPVEFRLFNLTTDLVQTKDVAADEKPLFESMRAKLLAIHAEVERDRARTKAAIASRQSEISFR